MITVYKYPLVIDDYQVLKLPMDAKILSAANIKGSIFLWAMIDTDQPDVQARVLRLAGTGHPLNSAYQYEFISTILFPLSDSTLVFHLFEEK